MFKSRVDNIIVDFPLLFIYYLHVLCAIGSDRLVVYPSDVGVEVYV